MKIINKEWCAAQGAELIDAIGASTSDMPASCAYGSSCICPDGIYFKFESGWAKIDTSADA